MQRILVVDDEHLVADTLSTIFRKQGFDVRTAYSVDEAMNEARGFAPQVTLCDITMPGKTGIDLMEELRHEVPDCRVLVLTGYYSNLSRVGEYTRTLTRPTPVMVKPIPPDELLRQVGLMLAS